MAADPQGEFTELVAYYKLKGFSAARGRDDRQAADAACPRSICTRWCATSSASIRAKPKMPACAPRLAMGFSFGGGSLVPILAFMLPLSMLERDVDVAAVRARRPVRRRLLRGNAERAEPDRQGTRSRAVRLRRLRDLVSRGPLHSAALRPRAGLGRRLTLVTLAHALVAGIAQAAAFFWDSLFGLIFGFLVSAIVAGDAHAGDDAPLSRSRPAGACCTARDSASSRRPARTARPPRRAASIATAPTRVRCSRS